MINSNWTFLADDEIITAAVTVKDQALLIEPASMEALLGWHVRDNTLCRDDRCLPLAQNPHLMQGDKIDLTALARLLEIPLAIEKSAQIMALGQAPDELAGSLRDGIAPDFTLPDLAGKQHTLSDHRGRKTLLVTWASWCGCREDLATWQEIYAELAPKGLQLITVSQDTSVEDARPFIERANPAHPSVIDVNHIVSHRYGLINVPTAVWIDEQGQIARPPRVEHASNIFQFAHGLDCEPHLAALRAWVDTGETDIAPDARAGETMLPTASDQQARAEHMLAFFLHAQGYPEAANQHWERAIELSPFDWTIRRGSMGLRGQNPFGLDFATVWEEWDKAGRPDYASLAHARAQA
jgi:peroxiredoxin